MPSSFGAVAKVDVIVPVEISRVQVSVALLRSPSQTNRVSGEVSSDARFGLFILVKKSYKYVSSVAAREVATNFIVLVRSLLITSGATIAKGLALGVSEGLRYRYPRNVLSPVTQVKGATPKQRTEA